MLWSFLPNLKSILKSCIHAFEGEHYVVTDSVVVQILTEAARLSVVFSCPGHSVPRPHSILSSISKEGNVWLELSACDGAPVLAVDFGQNGEVLATCELLDQRSLGRSALDARIKLSRGNPASRTMIFHLIQLNRCTIFAKSMLASLLHLFRSQVLPHFCWEFPVCLTRFLHVKPRKSVWGL